MPSIAYDGAQLCYYILNEYINVTGRSWVKSGLYLLIVLNMWFVADVSDSTITATICGSEEEALSLKQADDRESGDESESDQEGEVSQSQTRRDGRGESESGRDRRGRRIASERQ